MEIREAIEKANQILDEQRAAHTLSYEFNENEFSF